MRRAAIWVLGLSVGAVSAVRADRVVTPYDFSDPTVWRSSSGQYLALASGLKRMLVSDDFLTWKESGIDPIDPAARRLLLSFGTAKDVVGDGGLWAPDVTRVGDKWILAIATHAGKARETRVFSLVADRPEGPFRDPRQLVYSKDVGIIDCIDPEIVTEDGKAYLFFGSLGGVHRLALSPDARAVASGAKPVHVAGNRAGWNYEGMDKTRKTQFEGSYLHRRNGWWYLFCSAGWYSDETYCIKVGRARKLTDDFVDREGRLLRDGHATLVLASSAADRYHGPGHNGEIVIRPDGEYISYHCHDSRMPVSKGYLPRPMAIGRVKWSADGWPTVERLEGGK